MADASVIFSTDIDSTGVRSGLSKLKSSLGTWAKAAGIALGAVAVGLGALAKTALAYNSQIEQYYTSFTTLLGSEAKAAAKVEELREFAAKTPFEMTDLADATKTILGFGVAEEQASIAMKQLGDISQGNSARFSSLALVYGQMASTGKLMGQDLLQMINAGFNPLTIIAQKTGTTIGDLKHVMAGEKTSDAFKKAIKDAQAEVKKLGADASESAKMLASIGESGIISSELVNQAMTLATSEGGLFYGAMEKQSKTAAGLISTLKDNAKVLLGDTFAGASEALKSEALPAALGYVQQLSDALKAGGTPALMEALGSVLGDISSRISTFAPSIVRTSIEFIKAFLDGIKKNTKVIAKGIADTFKAAILGLIELAPDFIGVGLELLLELADSLGDAMPELLTGLATSAFNILVQFLTNVPRLLAAGAKIAQALVKGMIAAALTLIVGFWDLLVGKADDKINAALNSVQVNIKPEVSTEDQEAITAAINAGIAAADKVAAIQAEVDTDIDEFMATLDAAFADDKFTKKELTGLKKTLNAQVDDAIAQATDHIAQKREEYKQTLLTLVDENGQPIYTEAAAETLANAMTIKTQELTAELDQARTDLNNLLATIYASKTDPTQAQIDNINALLEQIGVLEVKLGSLQDQAVQVAEAKKGRVVRGEGTDEDFGVAVGYTGEMYKQETARIEADADERLAALQAVTEAEGATQDTINASHAQMDVVYGDKAQAQVAAAQAYNDEMAALYSGMAQKYPDAAKTVSNIADLSGSLTQINDMTGTLNTMNEFDPEQLSSFVTQLQTMYTDFYGMSIPQGDMDALLDPFTFATTASLLLSTFNDDIASLIQSNAAGLDDNPLMLYLQTMLDNGSFDNLDVTKVDGALKDALLLVDFVANGNAAGGQLVEGVNGGIGYAADNLSDEDIIKLRDAMLEEMRTVFGIHSPATSMFPIGRSLVDGVVSVMQEDAWKLEEIGGLFVSSIAVGVRKNMVALLIAIISVAAAAASSASSSAFNSGFAVGSFLGAGIAAGIISQAGAIAAAVAALITIGTGAGKDKARIHSPSGLTRDELGRPMGLGVGVGFVDAMNDTTIPGIQKSVAAAASAGNKTLQGTLLSRIQAAAGLGGLSSSGINRSLLSGSLLHSAGSVVNNNPKTIQVTQHIVFESTMQAPDEIARKLRKQATYGLAGANA